MTQLIPIRSRNSNQQINAIEFSDKFQGFLVTLAASTELAVNIPDSASFLRFSFPPGEIIYVSNATGIGPLLPSAGNVSIAGNIEINPGIRVWGTGVAGRQFFAFSKVQLTFGVYYYND